MNRSPRVAVVLAAVLLLASCNGPAIGEKTTREELSVWCEGRDRVFVWDSHRAGGLFVIPNHQECATH